MSFTVICIAAVGSVALLTAAAFSVRTVSRIWLRHWVERRLTGASLAELYLERPQRLLLSAGSGVALIVFLAGAAVVASAPTLRSAVGRGALLALLVLLLGQILPRAIARRWSTTLVPVLVPMLRVFDVVVAPMRWLARLAARPVASQSPRAAADEARDDIGDLLREGAMEGVGEEDEIAIITGVVQFGEKSARDVMTPRADVFAVDVSVPPMEQARLIAASKYSRVPVYRGTIDDVVGIVHAFDVLKCGGEEAPTVLPIAFTSVSKPCNELLFEMLRARRHLAVVREEDGTTAGVVSLEDLLEELVGDIADEHDEPDARTTDARAAEPAALAATDPRAGRDARSPEAML